MNLFLYYSVEVNNLITVINNYSYIFVRHSLKTMNDVTGYL